MSEAPQQPLGPEDVRWLNKVPLFVAGGVLFLVVSLFLLALVRRNQTPVVTGIESEASEELATRGSKAIGELVGSETTGGIIGWGDPEHRSVPEDRSRGDVSPFPTGVSEDNRKRARKFREDLHYETLTASSVVPGIDRPERLSDIPAAGAVPFLPVPEKDDPNLRARKKQFLGIERRYGYSPERNTEPIDPYVLRMGSIIPAILLSGINSDLPGMIMEQVSRNVRDRHSLIPQGARLIGAYDSHIAMGQRRVLVAWHRLEYPDAAVIELGNMPGADSGGYAGFDAEVDNHYARIFGNAFLLSLITSAGALAQPDDDKNSDRADEVSAEAAAQWMQLGQKMIEKNLNIQLILMVEPGYRFAVVVNQDLVLEPYGGR